MSSRPAVIPFQHPAPSLDDLAQDWKAAKRREEDAKEERIKIEQNIAALLPAKEGECTESTKTGFFKVSVSYGFTRKVDADMLKSAWPALKQAQQDAFRWKPEVSLTGLHKLDGQLYNEVATMITATPSKPSVKVDAL